MRARTLLIAVLVVAVALLAGCGGGNDENAATPPTTTAPETTDGATGKPIKVGLVTDIGGLDDRSFNFLANQGLERAEEQLGVDGRVLISKSESDYVPNLSSLARQDYELVIGVGFLMANAVEKVAKRFPDTSFAIIDFSQADMKSKPANVRGLLFKEQEAGYLAGYLAGLVTAEEAGSRQVISSVGGQKIPPVDRYIAGFRAGARRADPKLRTLKAYSQDFIDQAKCKEAALDQIAQGSRVVFQVAGNCGLGALSAAKEKNVWGIGVDADQSYLGDFILTSAVKKVDNAVFQTIQDEQEGSFSGGEDVVFDVASGGVGLGKISPQVTADIVSKVQSAQDDIAAGKITDIPTSVK
jgi:basic membrane protein A and related proteins